MISKQNPEQQSGSSRNRHDPVFYYADSGIRERHGDIPMWLIAVVLALIVWGIYYLVAYWSPPPA